MPTISNRYLPDTGMTNSPVELFYNRWVSNRIFSNFKFDIVFGIRTTTESKCTDQAVAASLLMGLYKNPRKDVRSLEARVKFNVTTSATSRLNKHPRDAVSVPYLSSLDIIKRQCRYPLLMK